jgi:8-oxo-dGTP diphosphatase
MYLFSADDFEGALKECDEGDLQWISRDSLMDLPQWEGDRIFLDLMWQDAPFFLLTLRYDGDRLAEAILNGEKIR